MMHQQPVGVGGGGGLPDFLTQLSLLVSEQKQEFTSNAPVKKSGYVCLTTVKSIEQGRGVQCLLTFDHCEYHFRCNATP
jgi:hypothetical protein